MLVLLPFELRVPEEVLVPEPVLVLLPFELRVPEEVLVPEPVLVLLPLEVLFPVELEVFVSAETVLPGPCTAVVTSVPSEETFKEPAASESCSRSMSFGVKIISA